MEVQGGRGIVRGHDLINSVLPDEALVEIMKYVDGRSSDRDACALVCRRWRVLERASRHSLSLGATGQSDSCLATMVRRFTNLRQVCVDERLPVPLPVNRRLTHPLALCSRIMRPFLQGKDLGVTVSRKRRRSGQHVLVSCEDDGHEIGLSNFSDTGLQFLAEGCPRLEKLCLIWCSAVTSSGLVTLAQACRGLKVLDMQGCYVGDQGLKAVGKFCKQLEELNLRFCEGVTDDGIVGVAEGCGPSLRSLGIAACARVTDVALQAVGSHCTMLKRFTLDSECVQTAGVLAIAQGCPQLQMLRLQCVNVSDEALQQVGRNCTLLETLDLFSFQKLSLVAIGGGCKRLRTVTLSDSYNVSDRSLAAIANGCPQLAVLEINGCHNIGTAGLQAVGRSCRKLQELVLKYCQKIGDDGLVEVGKGCSQLQALHLVDCSSIGDVAIRNIALGCHQLRRLHIRRCYKVGDRGIVAFGTHCKNLTDLSLRFCDRIGDDALIAIGQGCPQLRLLNVSGCHRVGDVGLSSIAQGCPSLIHLDVSVCQNVGDIGLAALGKGCPLLKEVILSHCRKITDIGLGQLVTNCKTLESCHMVYCPCVTSVGVATVCSGCNSLKKVLVEKWKVTDRTRRRHATILAELCMGL